MSAEITEEARDKLRQIGASYLTQKRYADAIAVYGKLLPHDKRHVSTYYRYGYALSKTAQYRQAVIHFQQAIALDSSFAPAYRECAIALTFQAKHGEAEDYFQRYLQFDTSSSAYGPYLVALNYRDDVPEERLFQVSQRYGALLAEECSQSTFVPPPQKESSQRLRVGYISSHLYLHSEAYAFLPLLKNHAASSFEIYCYCDGSRLDAITGEHRKCAHRWIETHELSDETVLAKIRADQIDILVDLSAFFGTHFRASVFAQRAAPIQMTWLGYPNTTGITGMDYRIVDAVTDPIDSNASAWANEKLLRVPELFICYDPLRPTPAVAPLPASEKERITFGAFNNLCKYNETTIRLWAGVLKSVTSSRLLMKNESFADSEVQSDIRAQFVAHGVSPDRLSFLGRTANPTQHLKLYGHIDVSLDTYPYHGTMTTCESLWMGVPVLTLRGQTHRSRVSVSILSSLGMQEWIAQDEADYLIKAVALTKHVECLAQIRSELRKRLQNSPLYDVPKFSKKMERLYQTVWERSTSEGGASEPEKEG